MSNLRKSLILLFSSLFLAVTCHATPQKNGKNLDLAEIDTLRGLFDTTHYDRYKEKLVFAYENYLIEYCRDELRTVNKVPHPSPTPEAAQNSCPDMLTRLSELLPEDPVAICFTSGFQNQACFEAYAKIEIKKSSDLSDPYLGAIFKKRKSDAESSMMDDLTRQLKAAENDRTISPAEQRKKIADIYEQIFKINCGAVVNKYQENFQKRSRYISDNCYTQIIAAQKLGSVVPQAACYRDGFISPRCQQSKMRSSGGPARGGLEQF